MAVLSCAQGGRCVAIHRLEVSLASVWWLGQFARFCSAQIFDGFFLFFIFADFVQANY